MVKVRLLNIVEDQLVAERKGIRQTEGWFLAEKAFFDGPVSRRVAVVDFDEKTGALLPGVKFLPPEGRRTLGRYDVDVRKPDIHSRAFLQLSVFSTVLKTLSMFEEPDTLGREVKWAFGGEQLLVVPVAGQRANALYERESRSLQFFYFEPKPGKRVYTALSQDIVSHEAAHAILDSVVPDLYHALTPQSLALHEAIADLAALMMSFRSDDLRSALLKKTNGSIEGETPFTWLAEEFGTNRDGSGRSEYLRSMWNSRTIDPAAKGSPDFVDPKSEAHDLSQVLTGALYRVVCRLHEEYKEKVKASDPAATDLKRSGRALFLAISHFQRLVFRALDYLPPGELSFADYGRAMWAADKASHPEDSTGLDKLLAEFESRGICPRNEFESQINFDDPGVSALDLETLVADDAVAESFAGAKRELLRIPAEAAFRVLPRLDSRKVFFLESGKTTVRECIFKVAWEVEEPNPPGMRLPNRRKMKAGTTLALDWKTRRVRALLSSHLADPRAESAERRAERDHHLLRLVSTGRLQPGSETGLAGMHVEIEGDAMRIQGSGRLLHIAS